jgi:lysine/ornithine N-monooxygenase
MKTLIKTNWHPRNLLSWYELTVEEQKDLLHYLDTEEKQSEANFIRYHKRVYDVSEFMRIEHTNKDLFVKWDGYISDTYFSGIVIRYVNDNEQVIVGTFFS